MCVYAVCTCSDTAQSDIGSSCFFTLPAADSDQPIDFFRILRVAYVSTSPKRSSLTAGDSALRRRGSAAVPGGPPALTAFTYETFTPELVAPRYSAATLDVVDRFDIVDRVETMNETFAKVIAFLQNSGTRILSIYLLNPLNSKQLAVVRSLAAPRVSLPLDLALAHAYQLHFKDCTAPLVG